MPNIYGPILPLQLDSRNTAALTRAIQTRIYLESGGTLNDFTPASPLSAISEGQAFAQAELLYYLNNLPEAFTLQWLRQLGIQRRIGSRALVDVTFYKVPSYSQTLIIPSNTRLYSDSGLVFRTLAEVRISQSEFSASVPCQSDKWGSAYNVDPGTINKIEKNFVGLEFLRNEIPASGGSDLESVDEMKVRAFEVLSRRNLTTSGDFEAEVRSVIPDASIVRVLTYEERNGLSTSLSGNIVICVGDEEGKELSEANLRAVLESMRNRVTLGTNVSLIAPEVIPVDVVVEIYYDPTSLTGSTDLYANRIFREIRAYLDPTSLPLGSDISYQEMLRRLYGFDFVRSVNTLDTKLMIRDNGVIEGFCAGFRGEETSTGCDFEYLSVVNATNQEYEAPSPIVTYRLYRAQVALTSINDFSSLTFSYDELYTP